MTEAVVEKPAPAASVAAQAVAQVPAPQAPAPGGEAAPAAGTPAPQADSFADEDQELARLLAAEEAERKSKAAAAANGGQPGAAGSAAAPGAAPAAAPQGGAPASAQPAKAAPQADDRTKAIIALRRENQRLAGELATTKGMVQALEPLAKGASPQPAVAGQPAAAAQPTLRDEMESLDQEVVNLAKRYEAGDLSASEWKEQEVQIQRRQREIQEEVNRRVAAEAAAQHAEAPRNDATLEIHAEKLERAYPVLATLTADQLEPFRQLAYEEARKEGHPIQANARGTMDLRERMARMAEQFHDPDSALKKRSAAGGAPAPAAAAAAQPAQRSQSAQPSVAQREAKFAERAGMPPDIAGIGSAGLPGEKTLDQHMQAMAGMREDQQLAYLEANPGLSLKAIGVAMPR